MHSWCQAVCSDPAREGSDLTHPEAAEDTACALRQGVVAAHRGEGAGADGRGKGKRGGSSNTEGVRGTAGGWPLPGTGMWETGQSETAQHPVQNPSPDISILPRVAGRPARPGRTHTPLLTGPLQGLQAQGTSTAGPTRPPLLRRV